MSDQVFFWPNGDFVTLSGAEVDTLYKLHFFGPQEDGDIPSKSGLSYLIEVGVAVKDYSNPPANRLTDKGRALAENYQWKHQPTLEGGE